MDIDIGIEVDLGTCITEAEYYSILVNIEIIVQCEDV